jgi:hypothetical protein
MASELLEEDFTLRFYEPGDEDGIVNLYRMSFPDWALIEEPIQYWRWKYLDSPSGSNITVAVSGGKVVGVTSSVFLRVKIGEFSYDTVFGDDAATHPDFRGRGIYSNLMKLKNSNPEEIGKEFLYTITYQNYIAKNHLRKGYQEFPRNFNHMIYIQDLNKHLRNISIKNKTISKIGYIVLRTLNDIINRRSNESTPDLTIEEVNFFDESTDAFWNKLKSSCDFILVKDRRYLNWRYCSEYSGNYTIFRALNNGEFLGYAVLEIIEENEYKFGNILDLITLPDRLDALRELLHSAMNFFHKNDINAIYTMIIKGHLYEKELNRFGFIERLTHEKMYLICNFSKINDSYTFLESTQTDRIYFSMGDYL